VVSVPTPSPAHDAPTLTFEYDVQLDRWSWSGGLRELYGLGVAEEPTTERLLDPILPADQPAMRRRLQEHLSVPGTFTCTYRLADGGGRTREVRFVAQSVENGGSVCRVEGFVVDVTEDVRAWKAEAVLASAEHRAAIEQAKGALMLAFHVTEDEAFRMLVSFSNRRNVKLHAVAAEIAAGLTDPSVDRKLPIHALLDIVVAVAAEPTPGTA
jgi:hypothetical protein